jgi:hypothetical protein
MDGFIVFLSIIFCFVMMIVSGGLYYLLRRALARTTELEEGITVLENQNTEAVNANAQLATWFEEFKSRVVYSYQRIKIIDAKGSFEADDEVGYFFKELKELIERLHEIGVMDEVEKQEALAVETPKITTEELAKVLSQRNAARQTKE